jgi:hypothetical protein
MKNNKMENNKMGNNKEMNLPFTMFVVSDLHLEFSENNEKFMEWVITKSLKPAENKLKNLIIE